VAIETKAIQVLVNPVDYFVDEPGETINISATVANANRTWLTWSADHGSFEDGLGAQTNDSAMRPLKTPTDVSLYPFSVTVVSASDLGLRGEEGAAVREATARVRLRQETLVIEPGYACLRHEETQAFTATGGGEAQLLWEVASGPGSIDANGLYVAPASGMETAVIRAWLEESPQIEATVSVDIASCDCYLNVEVTGDSQWSYEGSDIAYWIIDQAGTPYYQFNTQVPEEEGREVSGNIWLGQGGIGPNPGDTGMFPAAFGYRTSEMSWQVFFEDFNVDIEALTESYMIGVFEGPLVHYDNMGEIDSTVYLRAEFRARRYEAFGPGGSWPCE